MTTTQATTWDPITLEVFRNLFYSAAEEMGVTLCRTSFSPNIKERRDYSCAIFDGAGRLVAQGEHMPVHLGSMPLSVEAAIQHTDMEPGDVVVVNDPFCGGTHLPDITMVEPVFIDGEEEPSFFVASRAHHSDVGGITPGSMPLSTSIYQEGIRIPPVKIVHRGEVCKDVMAIILNNVRTPREREGDLTAQIASNRTGARRLLGIVEKYGIDTVREYMGHLQDYAERMTRAAIDTIPDGTYKFEDCMDDDGQDQGPLPIKVAITVKGDSATVDFTGTSPQVRGSINANYAITLSATMYCFRVIVPFEIPSNAGTIRPLSVIAPEGSLLNAAAPAAVAGGNVETSQRIVDTVLGALAQAVPQAIPAASSGTMNNLTLGGIDPRNGQSFAYYETTAGGMGARPYADGLDATHTHMTNSLNTPIEALEHAYPLRVVTYGIRRGSGGRGKFRGGDGIDRTIQLLCPGFVTVLSDRRKTGPYGLHGGGSGAPGRNMLISPEGEARFLAAKASEHVPADTTIAIHTPGGGAWGPEESHP
ncbi:MAG: hydantoinase B/oxoprolinase family protein [Gemmatimonadota bacterium]|nr:hydantoinase B/oxoprolinase family protein [Gemmatimonadota bacterium]MDH5803892.1 hydantoinase B/oxoprolinase family protein [Gemmatimonadota bacterium]